jgi:predicted RNA polymerase sigma factor
MDNAHRVVETVARDSYGRLVSYLSAHSRDVAGAEDALADAFLAALRTWPCDGVPKKPEAWLLATARHRLIDRARHDWKRPTPRTVAAGMISPAPIRGGAASPTKRFGSRAYCSN